MLDTTTGTDLAQGTTCEGERLHAMETRMPLHIPAGAFVRSLLHILVGGQRLGGGHLLGLFLAAPFTAS